ncbi:MAG: hypothetical protein JW793_01880 [Acidobacteria bacterium]|nr:hypothetical protein [Acidobacteriota bacterium]
MIAAQAFHRQLSRPKYFPFKSVDVQRRTVFSSEGDGCSGGGSSPGSAARIRGVL